MKSKGIRVRLCTAARFGRHGDKGSRQGAETCLGRGVQLLELGFCRASALGSFPRSPKICFVEGGHPVARATGLESIVESTLLRWPPQCRDNPGREVLLQYVRSGESFQLALVPELSPTDNFGQVGVKLTPNAELRHR